MGNCFCSETKSLPLAPEVVESEYITIHNMLPTEIQLQFYYTDKTMHETRGHKSEASGDRPVVIEAGLKTKVLRPAKMQRYDRDFLVTFDSPFVHLPALAYRLRETYGWSWSTEKQKRRIAINVLQDRICWFRMAAYGAEIKIVPGNFPEDYLQNKTQILEIEAREFSDIRL